MLLQDRVHNLHVASFHLLDGLRPGLEALVAEAHAAGLSVSLDPQGDPGGGDTALLLRLVWTAAEVLFTALVYWLPGQRLGARPLAALSRESGA